jgi:hypothetical protein
MRHLCSSRSKADRVRHTLCRSRSRRSGACWHRCTCHPGNMRRPPARTPLCTVRPCIGTPSFGTPRRTGSRPRRSGRSRCRRPPHHTPCWCRTFRWSWRDSYRWCTRRMRPRRRRCSICPPRIDQSRTARRLNRSHRSPTRHPTIPSRPPLRLGRCPPLRHPARLATNQSPEHPWSHPAAPRARPSALRCRETRRPTRPSERRSTMQPAPQPCSSTPPLYIAYALDRWP